MSPNLSVLLPILIPLAGAMVALLVRRERTIQAAWSLGCMLAGLACSLWLLALVQDGQVIVTQLGGWRAPFGITLVGDPLAAIFVVMVQLVVVLGIMYAMGSQDDVVRYPSFYPLFLLLAVGLTGTMLTGDLFNLFVFAELLVISGTILTALSDHRYGAEAAYKYIYFSLLASTFLLLSIGSLYVSYGTLNMADLAARIQVVGPQRLLLPGIAFMLAAFMVKSAVFPFHFWQPDMYASAPTGVSAVLSSVVSKLGVYGFIRMTTLLFVEQSANIQNLLVVLGVVGVIFGGLSAIGTRNLKRMLAFSSLSQIGFILVGIGWGTTLSMAAAIAFTFNHSLIKAAMLMLSGYVSSRGTTRSADFAIIKGSGKPIPAAGVLFFVGSLALAGIPPTNGFISKLLLFSSGIAAEGYYALLLIGIASILTMIYTIRAFMSIWWSKADGGGESMADGDRLLAPLILITLVVIFGLWAEPLVNLAMETSTWLSDPLNYIQAVLGG